MTAAASVLGRLKRSATRSSQRASTDPALTPAQIQSLGILLVAAQLPQAVHLPIWVALFGIALVALRFVLLRRDRLRPAATPARIPSWALAVFALAVAFAIRKSYGYFVGRDPCVASCSCSSASSFSKCARCVTERCSCASRSSC